MPELYLRVLDRVLTPVLLMLAIFLLLRGHNLPGGGFIAGLMAAAAFKLQILSRGSFFVRRAIGAFLQPVIGIGLLIAVSTAFVGVMAGGFFHGVWWSVALGHFRLEIGTPVLFDIGVFLVVLAVTTSYLLGISHTHEGY